MKGLLVLVLNLINIYRSFKKHLEKHTSEVWSKYVEEHGEPKSEEDVVISFVG